MAEYSLSNRKVMVSNKEMTFTEKLYLPAILKGMGVTLNHFFGKKVTFIHGKDIRNYSSTYRGLHVLKRDDEGRERCVACGLCAVACPAEAITMVAAERQPGEEHLYREEKYAAIYEINMLRCIFCGLCEQACPKEAIYLTDRLVDVELTRKDFIYGKDKLVEKMDDRIDISNRQHH
ncbi:MAG: NADH-quinone oxidoreductase subunit I [Chitinophagales bacterium]|nr:NADH-quinone oxidoreductase subunit I [Chitinophagales bacterium]